MIKASQNVIQYTDLHPPELDMGTAVLAGLRGTPKSIPPKFFYDTTGSRLFDEICAQPEYYPPDAEREILRDYREEIAELIGTDHLWVEPGAGSSVKIRLLLDELKPRAYLPMDIAAEHLKSSAQRLADDYPWLDVHAARTDFTHALEIPARVPSARRVVFFPGSSLGNFEPREAIDFLAEIRALVGDDGGLLIGIDTRKNPAILNAAYNDAAGVTAKFNLNLLHHLRRELNCRVNPEGFRHYAFYNEALGRIEMHLISRHAQHIELRGERIAIGKGENIHTENSYKYEPDEFAGLANRAGLERVRYWTDSRELFSMHYLRAC